MNNEEAIKVLNNSIRSRLKQVEQIEEFMNYPELREEWLREQRAIINALSVTLEQLMTSDQEQETEQPKHDNIFGKFGNL